MTLSALFDNRTLRNVLVLVLLLTAALWVYEAREIWLDDSFIYLSIGRMLLQLHRFTGDWVTPSYPTDPPYVVIAAAFERFASDPPAAIKIFSAVFYVGLLLWAGLRVLATRSREISWLNLGFLFAVSAPMATRWLSDGMDSSFFAVVCFALGLLCRFRPEARFVRPAISKMSYFLLALFGCFSVILRVESLYLIAVVFAFWLARDAALWREQHLDWRELALIVADEAHIAIGGLIGLAILLVGFGQVLPDTAIAKKSDGFLTTFDSIVHLLGASMTFGVTLCAIAAIAAAGLIVAAWQLRSVGRTRLLLPAIAVVVSALPLALLLMVLSKIQPQGARHVVWIFIFSVSAFISMLDSLAAQRGMSAGRLAAITYLMAATLVCGSAFRVIEARVFLGYAHYNMRDVIRWDESGTLIDWRNLVMEPGIASDVGRIMYFSGGRICDVGGLVNGRRWAAASISERLRNCASWRPKFLFLDADQYEHARSVIGKTAFARWAICATFPTASLLVYDIRPGHMVVVSPPLTPKVCRRVEAYVEPSGALPKSVF